MRRLAAVAAATVLVLIVAATSFASGPDAASRNRFVGNFDMLEGDVIVGRVVVNFQPPTYDRFVPGTLDVYWAPDTTFPFPPELEWGPAKESHAQLIAGFFGPDAGGIVAGAGGYLCDYSAPWNGVCRPFTAIFVTRDDGSRVVAWDFQDDFGHWYDVGGGAWNLTYFQTTG